MRISRILHTLAGLALIAGTAAYAQSRSAESIGQNNNRAYGYVDLTTGAFHPGPSPAVATPDVVFIPKNFAGLIAARITITISNETQAQMPLGSTILCGLATNAYVDGLIYNDTATSTATILGNTASCTVNLPYSWHGTSGGPTTAYYFDGSYKITVLNTGQSTQPITDYNIIRQTSGPLVGVGGITEISILTSGTADIFPIDATI